MTIRVTGNTFPYRQRLASLGGWFNRERKCWEFGRLSEAELVGLRGTVGLWVHETPVAPPPPSPLPLTRKPQFFGDDPSYFQVLTKETPRFTFGFSSLAALCDYIDTLKRPRQDMHYCDLAWLGGEYHKKTDTRTLKDATDLARYGWTDGLGMVEKFDIPYAENKRRINSQIGGNVNVGRLLAGNPVHMIKLKKMPKHRTLRLFIDFGGWLFQSKFVGVSRALIIAAIVDLLERQDYRCEIIATHASIGRNFRMMEQTTVFIKEANERLNMLDLTFACGHPAFASRLKNALLGTVPAGIDTHWRGFMCDLFTEDDYQLGPNEFHFPNLSPHACGKIDQLDDPMEMLPYILPPGLPLEIKI